jgi:hypothetical protein
MQLSRRDVLKLGVLGSAALVLSARACGAHEARAGHRLSGSSVPQFVLDFSSGTVIDPTTRTITLSDTHRNLGRLLRGQRSGPRASRSFPRELLQAPRQASSRRHLGLHGITPGRSSR